MLLIVHQNKCLYKDLYIRLKALNMKMNKAKISWQRSTNWFESLKMDFF